MPQRRREHCELAADHLQLAQALQRRERIAAGLLLARQAADLPATVGDTFQGQVEAAQAQFGERRARQQAGVDRHQHLGVADGERLRALADPQVVELQQGPRRVHSVCDPIERDRPAGALAQPGRDPSGLRSASGSTWLATPSTQRDQHQHDGGGVAEATAGEAQAAAEAEWASACRASAGAARRSEQHDIELLLRVLVVGLEADRLAEELLQFRPPPPTPRR